MRHLDLKSNFHVLFKCAHPRLPILLCTNFARHLVTKGNFHVLVARHPALVIIFHGALIKSDTVLKFLPVKKLIVYRQVKVTTILLITTCSELQTNNFSKSVFRIWSARLLLQPLPVLQLGLQKNNTLKFKLKFNLSTHAHQILYLQYYNIINNFSQWYICYPLNLI